MSDPILEAIQAERARASRGAAPRYSVGALFGTLRERMGEALAYRMGGPEPEDEAFRYVGLPFSRQVETLLALRGVRWESKSEMFDRAIGTGDVPALLASAGNRVMRKAYQSYKGGLLRFCSRLGSRDFRDMRAIQVDSGDGLMELKDGGAFTYGSLKASAETFPISSFGRIFAVTRDLIQDDDLAAFANLSGRLARMAAEFVAAKLAALLESNALLSDNVAVFASGHANLGTAGALSETTLGELLKLLRTQTGLGGEKIACVPAALVVPSALEVAAHKVVTSVFGPQPPLTVVVEPRLTSATAYYVLADPSTVDGIAYTYPAGTDGPTIHVGSRPSAIGVQVRVALDFGCGFVDQRGAAKNAGA